MTVQRAKNYTEQKSIHDGDFKGIERNLYVNYKLFGIAQFCIVKENFVLPV